MSRHGRFDSRSHWAAESAAAAARALLCDRIQRSLEDDGWDVTRLVGEEVTVVLEQPGEPEHRYRGATTLDALRLALSDRLGQELEP